MRTEVKAIGTKAARFRAIAWFLLLAFTLQSFITQTHIHGAFASTGGAGVVKTLANMPSHNTKTPADSPADCPFCQAIMHAGAFFAPSAPTLVQSFTWAEMVAPSVVAGAFDNFSSHPWHSRAPPQF
jgi:hypothetical protein